MRPRTFSAAFAALAVLALVAAACGGDGGGEAAAIRTEKGLGVAALASAQGAAQADGRGGAAEVAVPGAPPVPAPATGGDLRIAGPGFAPFPFFAQQLGQTGITVQGFGSATRAADSAVLEISFSREGFFDIKPVPEPAPGQTEPRGGAEPASPPEPQQVQPQEVSPISEADLQAVIDAIVAQGVSRDSIEFVGSPYFDPYFSSATLRVTISNLDALGGIVDAAQSAAAGLEGIGFQGPNVSYSVSDCAALELAAMQAAVEDANERGDAFGQALGVGRGAVVGASHYAYSPFGPNPCDPSFGGPYPLGGSPYVQGQSPEVQLIANVTITYAIQ